MTGPTTEPVPLGLSLGAILMGSMGLLVFKCSATSEPLEILLGPNHIYPSYDSVHMAFIIHSVHYYTIKTYGDVDALSWPVCLVSNSFISII
ncbi:hypothetical protein H0H92_006393 [Tricholoma furcatifolium]|nr:hypothetical protein H0H92_006393 [Tricholoma furcatifolium]